MSGLGAVFSIARSALAAQRYGINVTSHNIANVNTEGYSRQSLELEAKHQSIGGLILGQGVNPTGVVRASNQSIENQLMQQKSKMSFYKAMDNYMQVMEGVFNENPETSLSAMLLDFWNSWQDISNDPSGASERTALYEHSVLLSEQFNTLDAYLTELETDLTNSLSIGIDEVNQITNEIARINEQIPGMEAGGDIANDLRDKRNTLTSELAQYIDVKTFEQTNGALTIVTARGCTLVHGNSSYELEMGGDNGDRVKWQGSGDATVDITDYISKGKIGGWLEMRDAIVEKYKLDFNALAKEFVWAVNSQHSQGVGLEAFSAVTGTYAVSNTGETLGTEASGLNYYDKISDGSFKLWVYDSNGTVVGGAATEISVDADAFGTTLTSLKDAINAVANINASITTDKKLDIDTDSGYTFAFSDDTSNVLAALGINTFFTGDSAGDMGVNDVIGSDKNFIAAAQIDADGSYASGDNTNAIAIAELQNTPMDIPQWTCDRISGCREGSLTTTIETYYYAMVGSMGIIASGISRGLDRAEEMVSRVSAIRDSISAVTLDEEAINIIKFQSAYAAAARLISISDEMLNTLLSIK